MHGAIRDLVPIPQDQHCCRRRIKGVGGRSPLRNRDLAELAKSVGSRDAVPSLVQFLSRWITEWESEESEVNSLRYVFVVALCGVGTPIGAQSACGDLGTVTCCFDLTSSTLTINWMDNSNATLGYEIAENGVLVGTAPAGSSSFQIVAPSLGLNTYEISWICALSLATGDVGRCDASVISQIPAGTTDLILQLEGLDSGGDVGDIDSGAALETSLNNAGLSVFRAAVKDFDVSGLDFSVPERLWIMGGTFPNDTRLTVGELDVVAALNANGVGVYFESGDHWGGFNAVPSAFDARDGHEDAAQDDGDDTFTAMTAVQGS